MDMTEGLLGIGAVKYPLKGLWFVGREAYHGTRVLHWKNYDRLNPDGGATGWVRQPDGTYLGTGRNAPGGARDRLRRQWGGIWARGLAPRPLIDRLRAGEKFDLLKPKSPQELRVYNQWAVQNVLAASENLHQKINAGG